MTQELPPPSNVPSFHFPKPYDTIRTSVKAAADVVCSGPLYGSAGSRNGLRAEARVDMGIPGPQQYFSMTIELLLVEDNLPELRLIQEIAAHGLAPVRITTAHNCSGALARLSDAKTKPNLVIADMGVLEFGGVELMNRCNPSGIPVVVFSGSMNPKDQEKVLRLGVKEFVQKPSTLDEYSDAVRSMIAKWTAEGGK